MHIPKPTMSNGQCKFKISDITTVLDEEEPVGLANKIKSRNYELEAKYHEERAALEAKYRKLMCQPVHTKPYETLDGVVGVEGVTNNEVAATEQEEYKLAPQVLEEEISENEEGALKYLREIKWHRMDNPKGFKIDFLFDNNPYFKNTVLTKTYHMVAEDEPILEKAIGMDNIEFYLGKCLTLKKLKNGSKDAKPITKTTKNSNPPHDNAAAAMQYKEVENQIEQDDDDDVCNKHRATAPTSSDVGEAIKQASVVFADALRDISSQMGLSIQQEIREIQQKIREIKEHQIGCDREAIQQEIREHQIRCDREIRENQMRLDMEFIEKLKKLHDDLFNYTTIPFIDTFRAFNLIARDNTLMNLFYSVPDGRKNAWVKSIISYDKKTYRHPEVQEPFLYSFQQSTTRALPK